MKTKHQHFKIYKPYGMLSQFDSNAKHEQKKRFLSELGTFTDGTMPIGRLDKKSEGLLLLTTDGKLSNHINQSGIEKEYYALVDGAISAKAIQKQFTFDKKAILSGFILGIVNYYSIYMLLKALDAENFESSTIFTVNNVAIVMLSTLIGLLFFKEKLSIKNWSGIAIAIISIILVTLA